ncbi:MAG: hypothetical protein JNK67_25185 [Alphaproteobacteria bacterium]|nr:hypothetical protein [Alphaproteobacteria bacterium]
MRRILTGGLALGLVLVAAGARADAIDGDWCSTDGRFMTIRGPAITTPGGAQIAGDYDRHHAAYVVPPTEPGAGQKVAMTLVNEQTVHAKRGAAEGAPEVWKRCARPTS